MASDPFSSPGELGGQHLLAYLSNCPVSLLDPLGLEELLRIDMSHWTASEGSSLVTTVASTPNGLTLVTAGTIEERYWREGNILADFLPVGEGILKLGNNCCVEVWLERYYKVMYAEKYKVAFEHTVTVTGAIGDNPGAVIGILASGAGMLSIPVTGPVGVAITIGTGLVGIGSAAISPQVNVTYDARFTQKAVWRMRQWRNLDLYRQLYYSPKICLNNPSGLCPCECPPNLSPGQVGIAIMEPAETTLQRIRNYLNATMNGTMWELVYPERIAP